MTEIICGGDNPIEHIKDSHVVAIAKFAVSEFNKQNNSKLKFQTVVSGKYQVVCGMNFWIKLNVSDEDDGGCKTYEAHVYEQAWLDSRVLKYFYLEQAEKDTSKGAGWERFEFDKDAPVDDEEVEEGTDDDAAIVKRMGQSFRFSAIEVY